MQFTFQKNGTVIYETTIRHRSQSFNRNGVINDEMLVKWVAIVKKTTNGAQDFSVFCQPDNYDANKKIPSLPDDSTKHRIYCSLKQLQNTVDKVDEIALELYRRILDEVSAVGARVVKIIFKPSSNSTARLMENGDFRVKFQDGRLAVLKKCDDSIHVTNNKIPASLSNEERCMFEYAHKDALLMETFLENAPLKSVKSFPFHFSNNSQFIVNETIETKKEKNLSEQQTNHMISERLNTPVQQLTGKKCQSLNYVPRQSRAPLRTRNFSLKI
ncbi:unnamed protein product [Onchocerca flexuosa]|uniref:Zyg-1 polo box domain-containing protein n=1 Tax=Onchocerca flexuosa TaxID=387005 RepID=A0A3P7YWX6_9BILA|nr:unnamed protein product [Onchocerca flexuosa]